MADTSINDTLNKLQDTISVDTYLFFKFLTNPYYSTPFDPFFTVNYFDKETETKSKGVKVGELEEILTDSRITYSTLHVSISTCKLNATSYRRADIESARILLVDLDREVEKEELKQIIEEYKVHLVVESSPKKYHLYWKLTPGELPLETWSAIQGGLAWRFGGGYANGSDYGFTQPTKLIRVPGFERITKKGEVFTPQIVWKCADCEDLDNNAIHALFPHLGDWIEQYRKDEREVLAERKKLYKKLFQKGNTLKNFKPNKITGRNETIYWTIKQIASESGCDYFAAFEKAKELNETFDEPLEEKELQTAAEKGYSKGIKLYEHQQKQIALLGIYQNGDYKNSNTSNLTRSHEIPRSVAESSIICGKKVLETGFNSTFIEALDASIKHKNFVSVSKALSDFLFNVGHIRKSGICIHLQDKNAWDNDICYPEPINQEQTETFFLHLIDYLVSEYNRTKPKGSEVLKKLPTQSVYNQICKLAYKACTVAAPIKTQPEHIIVFQNGIIDLEKAEFTPDPDAPLKYSHPIWANYIPLEKDSTGPKELDTPIFSKYMNDWFPEDPDTEEALLRFLGYSMTTDCSKRMFAFFHGATKAGKGSVSRTMAGILGDSNYCTPSYQSLDPDKSKFGLSGMYDKLLVVIDEVKGSSKDHEIRLNELKRVVNTEKVDVEFKFRDPFKTHIFGKVIMQSNEIPNYQDRGDSIKGRMLPFEFEQSFKEKEVIDDPSKIILKAEGDLVASKAARAWVRGYRSRKPFKLIGSKAIMIGESKLSDNMNVVEYAIKQFCYEDPAMTLSTSVVQELVQFIAEMKEQELKNNNSLLISIKDTVSELFKERVTYSRNVYINESTRCRGWEGIYLNRQKLIASYPELEENPYLLAGKMQLAALMNLQQIIG